jgi:Tfp pilus assembly protein PilW
MNAAMNRRRQRGFGTMEALVAATLTMIVALAIMGFFDAQQRAYATLSTYAESQHVTRTAIDLLGREIRMASYDPLSSALTVCGPPTCGATTREGITEARPQRIRIRQDLTNDGIINAANEDVIYFQQGTTIQRTDVVLIQTVTLVEGVPANGLTIRYFWNTPMTELVPGGSPSQLTQAQRALVDKVRIQIRSSIANPYPGGEDLNSVVRSTVAVRNRSIGSF